ncbi:hypothetical protein BDA96_07G090300 [Sorghum bicolor]|jgi:hypothetical protein|uniref:Uncharacterized protein n=1 Tax=Sorghum bicolor TaxID=4558 RepID=A0A921U8X0_SORBI|nr:hypothetical protein BDA96_07G090300 [Sorghum bicolor]
MATATSPAWIEAPPCTPEQQQARGGGTRRRARGHPPTVGCLCFECYGNFWSRWDCSPQHDRIHDVLEAFEEHLRAAEFAAATPSERLTDLEPEDGCRLGVHAARDPRLDERAHPAREVKEGGRTHPPGPPLPAPPPATWSGPCPHQYPNPRPRQPPCPIPNTAAWLLSVRGSRTGTGSPRCRDEWRGLAGTTALAAGGLLSRGGAGRGGRGHLDRGGSWTLGRVLRHTADAVEVRWGGGALPAAWGSSVSVPWRRVGAARPLDDVGERRALSAAWESAPSHRRGRSVGRKK